MENIIHGGDRYRNAVELDFSINVNPFGMPESVRETLLSAVAEVGYYPDVKAANLYAGLAQAFSLSEHQIVCGNGASELLMALMHAIKPKKVLLPVPSFLGYQHAIGATDAQIIWYKMEKDGYVLGESFLEQLTPDISMVFLTNPNNPTGTYIDHGLLSQILQRCSEQNIFVVLDECFMELSDAPEQNSCISELKRWHHLLILRAFTKSFAIPGIRLGYLLGADSKIIAQIKRQLPEWNLSIPAQAAGCSALKERGYLETSRSAICQERQYLIAQCEKLQLQVFASVTNFLLIKRRDHQPDLYRELLRKGILIRACENYQGLDDTYYRIAVRTHEENQKLIAAMKELNMKKIEIVHPKDIEEKSFAIIQQELEQRGIVLPADQDMVTRRVIHTSADFEYAQTLTYSNNAVGIAKQLLRGGADIVTDTNMGLAGVNKSVLAALGGKALCFMAEPDVIEEAKTRGITRAAVSMERAASRNRPTIFAIGNAPTALIRLYELMQTGWRPDFVIGVPVGFVNVEAAKELFLDTDIPYIINVGRKGGSNVAAAICNALLYEIRREGL